MNKEDFYSHNYVTIKFLSVRVITPLSKNDLIFEYGVVINIVSRKALDTFDIIDGSDEITEKRNLT